MPFTISHLGFPTTTNLRTHMNTHNPKRRHICDKCGKCFQTSFNLKKHLEIEHPAVLPEPLHCTICDTWYRNADGLKAHNKNMHQNVDVEHRCHICKKVSTTHRALLRHINLNHVTEKKHKCTMCEKAFKRSQNLKEHISVHTGVALYTCPNCPLTFSSSANMYRHRQRSHKAEYEAGKQQKMPRNIIKEALSRSRVLPRSGHYSRGKDKESQDKYSLPSCSTSVLTLDNTNLNALADD